MSKHSPYIEETLAAHQGLRYLEKAQILEGDVAFECCYEPASGFQPSIPENSYLRDSPHFISDSWEIAIFLASELADSNDGYPLTCILDTKRLDSIVKNQEVESIADLHINIVPVAGLGVHRDGHVESKVDLRTNTVSFLYTCCLLLGEPKIAQLPLPEFIIEAVLPFLYRLSYVERFGLQEARDNLWGEYAHGKDGLLERKEEYTEMGFDTLTKNSKCLCGSGQKFKRCHRSVYKSILSRASDSLNK